MMYIVQEGEVNIMIHGQLIETVGPGGIVGEMGLSLNSCPMGKDLIAKLLMRFNYPNNNVF